MKSKYALKKKNSAGVLLWNEVIWNNVGDDWNCFVFFVELIETTYYQSNIYCVD